MSLNGEERTYFANGDFSLGYTWSATQDIPNNRSTITVSLWIQSHKSYAYLSDATSNAATITIGEGSWAKSQTVNTTSSVGANTWRTLATFSATIDHYGDGTLQVPIRVSHNIDYSWNGSYIGTVYCGTGKWTLDTIPRGSSMIFSRANGNLGEQITSHIYRASDSFTHDVYWSWNKDKWLDGQWGYLTSSQTSAVDFNWTIPTVIGNLMPNQRATWVYVYLDTYSGSTRIAQTWYRFDVSVPDSQRPTIGNISYRETEPKITGKFPSNPPVVQNLSKLALSCSDVSAKLGASISSYRWTLGPIVVNGASATISNPNVSGSQQLTLTVTDSRGLQASMSQTLNLQAYLPPGISGQAYRTGEEQDKITVERKGRVEQFTGLTASYSTSIRWREFNGVWSANILPKNGTTSTFEFTDALPNTFAVSKTYEVEISVTDGFNNTTAFVVQISTVQNVMAISKTGVGIGKLHEKGALDVKGEIYSDGRLVARESPLVSISAIGGATALTPVAISRIGSRVYMQGEFQAPENGVIFKIPYGYRPAQESRPTIMMQKNPVWESFIILWIKTNGDISILLNSQPNSSTAWLDSVNWRTTDPFPI